MYNCSLGTSCTYFNALVSNLFNPALLLLSVVAVLIFLWGVVEFLWSLQKGEDSKDGKQHMLWGLVGLFIIFGAWGIFQVIQSTVNSLGH